MDCPWLEQFVQSPRWLKCLQILANDGAGLAKFVNPAR